MLLGVPAGARLDRLDERVVVGRIVVGESELAHPRRGGQPHRILVGAVAPVLPGSVLLRSVLRIVNHQAGAGHEARVAPVSLVRDGLGVAGRRVVVPERFGEGLVVAQVHNRRAVGLDAVAQRHRRMMEVLRDDPRAADLVRSFSELPEGDGGRKLADLDGEVRELHLTGENFGQRMSAPFRTADRDLVPANEERGEEGEALDVIPVRVAEQDHCRDGLRGVCHELRAQRASARPAVEYEAGPPLVVTSTHEVLPPKRTVPGPGVAIDPRVPQNRTRMLPPVSLFVVHVESVEIPRELRSPRRESPRLTASSRLLQGGADLRDPVQAVAGA